MTTEPSAPVQTIDVIVQDLSSGNTDRALQRLWLLGGHDVCRGSDAGSVVGTMSYECSRLKVLLTENTRIKEQPFMEFVARLSRLLSSASGGDQYDPQAVWALQHAFAEYRRNPDYFAPLGSSVRLAAGGWGRFLYCAAAANEFFATASGEAHRALIHFDQWWADVFPGAREDLTNRYIEHLEEMIGPASALVVVKKDLGPEGPIVMRDTIRSRFGLNGSTYEYDQRSNDGSGGPTVQDAENFVVLYDLLNTGTGIQEIEHHLEQKFRGKPIEFLLLYDHDRHDRAEIRSEFRCVYDCSQHPSLGLASLPALASRAIEVRQTTADEPFYRAKLRDLDSGALIGNETRHAWTQFDSPDVRRRYGGQWVAMSPNGVVVADERLDHLNTKIDSLSHDVANSVKAVRFVLPSSYGPAHVGL